VTWYQYCKFYSCGHCHSGRSYERGSESRVHFLLRFRCKYASRLGFASFHFFTEVRLRDSFFWDMTLGHWVIRSWRFEWTFCLHLQGFQCPENPAIKGHIPEERVSQIRTCSSGRLKGVMWQK
jgi:hypothetical protein